MTDSVLSCALLLATGCATNTVESKVDRTEGGRYPAHWWEQVPESDRAWWEILPQAAGPAAGTQLLRHSKDKVELWPGNADGIRLRRRTAREGDVELTVRIETPGSEAWLELGLLDERRSGFRIEPPNLDNRTLGIGLDREYPDEVEPSLPPELGQLDGADLNFKRGRSSVRRGRK